MRPLTASRSALCIGTFCALLPLMGQAAPGEDPLVLSRPVEYMALPLPKLVPSGALDPDADIPSSIKAKIVRYEAKAFNAPSQADDVLTNNDVQVSTAEQGMRKTCVQQVGSTTTNTAFNRFGPSTQPQMVVLRADLINVCR